MFELNIRTHFSAAHHLVGYAGSCAALHGHNWGVEVFVRGAELDASGILVDFRVLKAEVRALLKEFDHTDLNASADFKIMNPTSENLARHLFKRLSGQLNCERCRIARVTVCETPDNTASYWEDDGPQCGRGQAAR